MYSNNHSNTNPIYNNNKTHSNLYQNPNNDYQQNIQMKKIGSSSSLGMNISQSNQMHKLQNQKPPTNSSNNNQVAPNNNQVVTPTKKLNL
jgi:hypothetical protein